MIQIGKKRSQVITMDLFLALIIFMLIIIAYFSFIILYEQRLDNEVESNDMKLISYDITEFLCSYNTYWKNDTQKQPGIGYNYLNISQSKLDDFLSMNETYIKQAFNIKRFDFYFEVAYKNGTILFSKGTKQQAVDLQGKLAVGVTRNVLLNETALLLNFVLYEK